MRTVFISVLFSFLVSGCAKYSFDINNNQVYVPPTIYTDFDLPDPALKTCIKQAIRDQNISSPSELKNLQCSYSGIQNLEGLDQFSRIEKLSFKGNQLTSVDYLLLLTHLEYLDISENPITDCQAVTQLRQLLAEKFIHGVQCQIN